MPALPLSSSVKRPSFPIGPARRSDPPSIPPSDIVSCPSRSSKLMCSPSIACRMYVCMYVFGRRIYDGTIAGRMDSVWYCAVSKIGSPERVGAKAMDRCIAASSEHRIVSSEPGKGSHLMLCRSTFEAIAAKWKSSERKVGAGAGKALFGASTTDWTSPPASAGRLRLKAETVDRFWLRRLPRNRRCTPDQIRTCSPSQPGSPLWTRCSSDALSCSGLNPLSIPR